MRKLMISLMTIVVSFLIIHASTLATSLNVPDDYLNIQAAIDAAVSGDTVQVAPGHYYESIILKSGVIVQGAGAALTTIHKGSQSSVVSAFGGVSNAKIMGFTITGGSAYRGGGISVTSNSSITIANNIITGNQATGDWGGGILVYHSSAIITGNIIFQNYAKDGGGGIASQSGANTTITNNIIVGNIGGGIHSLGSSTTTTVTNNTIVDNIGGGIRGYNIQDSSTTITNNIIWGNGDDLDNCSATYSNIEDGDAGTGNISADPMFVDPPSGDYHLQPGSPCINAGNNTAVLGWPTADFEGDPRIVYEIVDIGADEAVYGTLVSCIGFEPPMDKEVFTKKKNRVLPLKMILVDQATGIEITDAELGGYPPLVEVDYDGGGSAVPEGEDYLPAGQGDEGNEFTYLGNQWQFNLQAKNFSGQGGYTIIVVAPAGAGYTIDPNCIALFTVM